MTWALIRNSDNAWLAGPLEVEPETGENERAIVIALGWPDTCEWSPSRSGFVDLVQTVGTRRTKLQFQRLFTLAERIAVRASGDPIVVDYRELGQLAEDIDLADADVVSGVNYLETIGLIGSGRAAQILAGAAPGA